MAGYTLYLEELESLAQKSSNKSLFSSSSLNMIKPSGPELSKENLRSSGRVEKLFRPFRILLTLLGRWPFQLEERDYYDDDEQTRNGRKPTNQSIHPQFAPDLAWIEQRVAGFGQKRLGPSTDPPSSNKKRIRYYKSSIKSIFWIYFIFTTLFLSVTLIFSILGFCDFFLDWKLFATSSWDDEEQRNFESNLVPFVLVWSCLMHSSLSSISFIINRKKVVKYFNYWDYAVDAMCIDVPKGIRRYILMSNVAFLGFLGIIFIAYRILCLGLVRGGAVLVGILTFRPFIFMFDITRDLFGIRIFGMVTILYAVYSSRAFLIIFSYKTKLLRHAFKVWNTRLKILMKSPANCKDEQLRCEKAFFDYKILLKLVKGSDSVFGAVLQSYYGSQLLNMCFELYYLARSGAYNKDSLDILAALIVLIQNLYIFFTVSLDAAYVNEEATRGLEILRRSGISPTNSIYRKYLMTNMQIVFSQKVVLTGGKYFSVDRPFIVTVLGGTFTYFIIVLQVGPSLHKQIEESGVQI